LPKGSKEKLLEIGSNIRDVYALHIKKLDWMSEPTKQKALQKLNSGFTICQAFGNIELLGVHNVSSFICSSVGLMNLVTAPFILDFKKLVIK
jgi:hypothetical protein